MKILITGANGQLGREFVRQAGAAHELILTDIDTLDITDHQQVRDLFRQHRPQAVVHCAAYTNVDKAENDPDGAFRVNVVGTQNLASQCMEHEARLVYISTDYVFDGRSDRPYREFDAVQPLSVYGQTKLWGEKVVRQLLGRHYILRTAWLYGDGNNFVKTMIRLAGEQDRLRVVDDQIGTPTYAKDLVAAINRLLATDAYGTYHATCGGQCSWYQFASKILALQGIATPVEPVPTAAFPRPAVRPAHAVLDNHMLRMTVGDPLRSWEEALADYLQTLK